METQQDWYGFFAAALLNSGYPLEKLVEQHGADQVEAFLDAERRRDPSNVRVQPGEAHSAAAMLAINRLVGERGPPEPPIDQDRSSRGVTGDPPDSDDTADAG